MTLRSSSAGSVSAIVATAFACGALALPAPATAGGFAELRITVRLADPGSPGFLRDVRSNCGQFYVKRLRPKGSGRFVSATARGAERGTIDVAARRGEVRALGAEWQIGPSQGAYVRRFSDLGVQLDGSRAYVTAIVNRSRGIPRGPRTRIAVIRGARIESGLMNDVNGRAQPSTARTRITGRFVVLAPITRAIGQLRCRGRARKRIEPGDVAGEIRFERRPERASGLAGVVRLTVDPGAEGVAVEPTGGSAPDGQGNFVAPITSGLPVPIVCNLGLECFPSGGTFTVGGGFDLVHGGARASVANLTVTSSGTGLPDVVHTVTGTLNGSPVTVTDRSAPDVGGSSEDYARRVSAILGTEAYGSVAVRAEFTRTGP